MTKASSCAILFLCLSSFAQSGFAQSGFAQSGSAQSPNPNQNVAAQGASVIASDSYIGHPPANAADGSDDSYWDCVGSRTEPCWIEMDWKDPVSIRELVFKRWGPRRGASDLMRLKAEVFDGTSWRELTGWGDSNSSLPLLLYLRVPQTETTKLRIRELDGDTRLRELEIYSENTPSWIDIRGDARGNAIGSLTDGFGAEGIRTQIHASGQAGGKPWNTTAETVSLGEFTVPVPVGMTGAVEFSAMVQGQSVKKLVNVGDIQRALVPEPGSEYGVELQGQWAFQPDPPRGFEQPAFNDSSWKPIDVPSHWVMQGFRSESGYGGYRRHVRIPESWRGRLVRIAVDGVYSGAEVWWNGIVIASLLEANWLTKTLLE